MSEDRCISCGEIVPEGRMVCPNCERGRKPMIQTHCIKIQQKFADAVFCGDKSFEIRYNDRGYQKGDLIRFRVMDGDDFNKYHFLNDKTYEITYVLSGWGICEGYVGLAIKEKPDEAN